MKWYNEPKTWQKQAEKLIVQTEAQTDFWRVTLHDFIQDNAHFYYKEVVGDFSATVCVKGAYASLYDQAGLMVRESEKIWIKCGIEYLDGMQHASAVITRNFSDCSIVSLPDDPSAIWTKVQRTGSAIEIFYSRDGEDYTLIRQGYLSQAMNLQVGLMCAAPKGEGFQVEFNSFIIII
jgi:hypothetical protein